MDIEGKLKRSFGLCSDNLAIFLPRAIELALEVATFLAFAIFFVILLGLSLSPIALASIRDPYTLLSGLEMQAFFLAAFLIFGVFALLFLTMLLRAFARAAVIGMADEGLRTGKMSLATGWRAAKIHGFNVFWALVLVGVIIILLLAAGFMPFFIGALLGLGDTLLLAFGFVGLLFGIIATVLFHVLTLFTPQAVVLNGKGAVEGIKGSIRFVKANPFDVIIYIAVVAGISIAVGMLTFGAFLPISILSGESSFLRVAMEISQNMISVVIGLLLAPYYETVKTAMVAETREGSA